MTTNAYCTNCGQPVTAADNACANCGQWLQRPGATPSASEPPGRRSSSGPIVAAIAVVSLLLVALAVGLLLGTRTGKRTPVAAVVSAATTPPSRPTSVRPSPKRSGTTDVAALPAGLFCRDLKARGYSYVAAISYWRAHGQPNQMDADRNGIPCETVYSRADVASYWSGRDPGSLSDVSAGLFCADLQRMGYGYPQAVSYWYWQDRPARMDADGNSIPCETVYSSADVASFWGGSDG